ncbi:MAG: NAD(P)-binding protein [Candidatus Pacearchaeota archaeon]
MINKLSETLEDVPRKIKIFILILFLLLTFGTFSFKLIKKTTIKESFIRTLESFAFIFHEEAGLGKALEIFLAIFGVFLIWWIFWSFFDIALEGLLTEYLKTSWFFSKLRKMKNHYIIAGGGRVGEEIAKNLSKFKKNYVIVEKDETKVNKLKKKGFYVIQGDVEDPETDILKKTNIKQANALILAMPETEKNLLVTLMAKEINPNIEIYARADNPAFVSKLKKAGAKLVVVPEIAAAQKFIQEIQGIKCPEI